MKVMDGGDGRADWHVGDVNGRGCDKRGVIFISPLPPEFCQQPKNVRAILTIERL